MKQFVLIFHQGTRKLSEQELKTRDEEIKAWARQQISGGRKLEARMVRPGCQVYY
jgi:hypothetical protein